MVKIELGPGDNGREGYFGLDIDPKAPNVTRCDFEHERLPIPSDSVDAVFSAHCLEHLHDPKNVLREIVRVCKDGAEVEIWTPYGPSADAMCIGHHIFWTERQWSHICNEFPEDWLGNAGRFVWNRLRWHLCPDVEKALAAVDITLPFALRHLNNIAWEIGVFLTVQKTGKWEPKAPKQEAGYSR